MNNMVDSAGPYSLMINSGSKDGNTWDSNDRKDFGPYESFQEAKDIAEDYVRANKNAWVIVLDKNQTQVLAHVPWSKKPNKWN